MRILFATTLWSPFQLELASEMNAIPDVHYSMAATVYYQSARGEHWLSKAPELEDRLHVVNDGLTPRQVQRWLFDKIVEVKPDIVVAGQIKGPVYHAAAQAWREAKIPFGFWLELPRPRVSRLYEMALLEGAKLRLRDAKFVLAIGDRAESYYRQGNPNVALVPYGQKLELAEPIPRVPRPEGHMRFLFSGQLLPRHNIDVLMEAVRRLYPIYGKRMSFTIAAKGPEQHVVDRALERTPELKNVVSFDRDYVTWNDRLVPFAKSDVLVYPCSHSGWGLVIPEAMSAGMPVLTTRRVEAARYFVRHRVNGVFLEPTVDDLVREMRLCLDAPHLVDAMGQRAKEVAQDGDVKQVAPLIVDAIRRFS